MLIEFTCPEKSINHTLHPLACFSFVSIAWFTNSNNSEIVFMIENIVHAPHDDGERAG